MELAEGAGGRAAGLFQRSVFLEGKAGGGVRGSGGWGDVGAVGYPGCVPGGDRGG